MIILLKKSPYTQDKKWMRPKKWCKTFAFDQNSHTWTCLNIYLYLFFIVVFLYWCCCCDEFFIELFFHFATVCPSAFISIFAASNWLKLGFFYSASRVFFAHSMGCNSIDLCLQLWIYVYCLVVLWEIGVHNARATINNKPPWQNTRIFKCKYRELVESRREIKSLYGQYTMRIRGLY